jgi:Protein of unknown function (DUF3122)
MNFIQTGQISLIALVIALAISAIPVQAEVQMLKEGTNQILFQTRRQLKDEHGQNWQAIAFKRVSPGKPATLQLRLVVFPGQTEPIHPKPAILNIAGASLSLPDITEHVGHPAAPPTGVSQYDLHSAVTLLGKATSATLSLPMTNGQTVVLKLPKNVLNEWWLVWNADSANTPNHSGR